MIEIVVAKKGCPHCATQRAIMSKSFFGNEYRIIEAGTPDFDAFDMKDKVQSVPFVVVRDETGTVRYAETGVVDGTTLRRLERGYSGPRQPATPKTFNLKAFKEHQMEMMLAQI
jgi:glutaredoxin